MLVDTVLYSVKDTCEDKIIEQINEKLEFFIFDKVYLHMIEELSEHIYKNIKS